MFRIVRASSAQLDTVLTLVEALLRELADQPPHVNVLDRGVAKSQLMAAKDRFVAFLALNESDLPIGVITLAESVAAYAGGFYGIIAELYVEPAHRNAAVGQQLLHAAAAEARARGWRRLEVAAPPDPAWDRTVSFYTRNGFVVTGKKLKQLL